jgi:disulfide bond formation protein DsbB
MDISARLAVTLNALALYAISAVLAVAFYWQFAYGELPCPLCMLQRVSFSALAIGPILAIRHGPKPRHYGLTILAALMGAAISARQILLHITPGDPGFGSPLLGLHFYTWAFLAFVVAILAAAAMLNFSGQFAATERPPRPGALEKGAVWLVMALTVMNAASALAECGFGECPSNPVRYELFN